MVNKMSINEIVKDIVPSLLDTMYCGSKLYYHKATDKIYELVGNNLVPYIRRSAKGGK
jgi:hypothetical protein